MNQPPVFSIGHSNRTLEEFTALLQKNDIEMLIDVRAFPGSRRLPHFGQAALAAALTPMSIEYLHHRDLGGRRKSDTSSLASGSGDGWRNASFRSYAEYTQSERYERALEDLISRAREQHTAMMCSEAVPWRCHRWLISDTLLARDIPVLHIIGAGPPRLHLLSPFAMVHREQVTWPGPPSTQSLRVGPAMSTAI